MKGGRRRGASAGRASRTRELYMRAGASEPLIIGGQSIDLGERRDVPLKVSETYLGQPVSVPVRVIRGLLPGPTVFLTGAVHGDEINGTGIVREMMFDSQTLTRGSLICVPVANIFGFENHSRYLPDRRDLNRCFPGAGGGSLAFRLAHVLFQEVVSKCDVGIDLHTAAARRTNFPHIRGDLRVPGMRELALAFGCEVVVDKGGHEQSLRSTATAGGCKTLLYEAGEAFKFEPGIIELGLHGVRNVLRFLDMLPGRQEHPVYQTIAQKTVWVRAGGGGLLRFHVRPGDLVEAGDPLATCEQLLSDDLGPIRAPVDGIVVGMTTLPAVKPGTPVCHLAIPDRPVHDLRDEIARSPKTLHRKVQRELGTSFHVAARTGSPGKSRGRSRRHD